MAYSKKVLDHFKNPKNIGKLDINDKNVGVATVGSPSCGDMIYFTIKINENNIIEDVKYLAYGCGSAIASSSYASEKIKGENINNVFENINNESIAKELELPPLKRHCSILAQEALEAAIDNYKKKNNF